mmetsp:Transcript_14382/g.27640  ORF Transcript_14382/g.27640 Transcript_14382/m.27640 type:complete len:313 (-) Transcript_14382:264-1202(-)|eukprot:CAMPEP_0114238994 /NCGR_PEP_ID=MMETSP0058-20121206/8215_1 /TAXON_ID=36894 /ORGANISM="Pyramimonas parkeae, CCMP726" /LENGTH=312 /DNA_ID=CAMNT_0001351129 /DNA_START=69 /DNA_END=1007 /DNA_ORIENTATION=+
MDGMQRLIPVASSLLRAFPPPNPIRRRVARVGQSRSRLYCSSVSVDPIGSTNNATPKKSGAGNGTKTNGLEYGPVLPAHLGGPDPHKLFTDKPDWSQLLEEEALHDEEIAELLEDCEGDPKKIYDKIKTRFEARSEEIMRARKGREEGMAVVFREYNPQDLWIWFELYEYPVENERKLLEEVVDSWFTLGHLGGFNCLNMQVLERGNDVSFMDYKVDKGIEDAGFALFHNMDELQYKGTWARFWVDLGSADELAIDILLNSLMQLSKEYVGIKKIFVGGINEDWKEDTLGRGGGDLAFRLGQPRAGPRSADF